MITATATAKDGSKRLIILGITKENVERLLKGQPIHVDAETHTGFPLDLSIMIAFGESEQVLLEAMKPLISPETRVMGGPNHPTKSSPMS